jgi:hypothetical protein
MDTAICRVRWLLRHIGRRGAFLGFLALLDIILSYSIIQPLPLGLRPDAFYRPFIEIMPLVWWSRWWLATAVLVVVAAVVHRVRTFAFGAAAMIKMAWALGYLVGWVDHDPAFSRGYQTATIFAAFAAIVVLVAAWRENGE